MESFPLTVVAYDVASDRRRACLARLLEDYGTRVQFSVFECSVPAGVLDELRQAVNGVIHPGEDRVAYYRFCHRCSAVRPVRRGVLSW
jgi:CRISPR-associated protein Cas2